MCKNVKIFDIVAVDIEYFPCYCCLYCKATVEYYITGLFMGFVLTLSSFSHVACLFAFLVSSTKATKFRATEKKKIEADFKEGGQRNWVQVLCNGGMATQLALLYLLDVGNAEQPIDFDKYYRSSWLSVGILGIFISYDCNEFIDLASKTVYHV